MISIYYNRKLNRIKDYDYSQNGYYYITICTHNREEILGNIKSNSNKLQYSFNDIVVNLTNIGKLVEQEILNTNIIRNNIKINNYIIMPNHVHMIIEINNPKGTLQRAPTVHKFGDSISNSIPIIVGHIKGAVTKNINKEHISNHNIWQRNYYEHIIRTDVEYLEICKYMVENPLRYYLKNINKLAQ